MSDATNDVILHAKGVRRFFRMGRETIEVLQGLDLLLRRGESVSVLGASGSGKTTMINVLGLLDRPQAGSIELLGEDALAASGRRRCDLRNRGIGFVFQFYHLVNELTALDNVCLPAMVGAGWTGWFANRREVKARAAELLEHVGLGERLSHRPMELSGGERQRVAIARALVNRPAVIFCDEPTGNLDPRTSQGVQDLLLGLGDTSRALLLVTHDRRFAKRCDHVFRLKEGRLVEDPGPGGDA